MGSHLHSAACLLILSIIVFSETTSSAPVPGESANCPCKVQGEADVPRCRGGQKNTYRTHVHEDRGLTGSCLPEVEENTVRCFKWKTRSCEDTSDFCELVPREEDSTTIPVTNGHTATLLSPRFKPNGQNQKFGLRWFCVYNVSLSCESNAVDISRISQHTSWPGQSNRDCENYLAFYSDRNSAHLNNRYCGKETVFHRSVEGSSFLAVMWSNQHSNIGTFQFTASCQAPAFPPSPTQATTVDPIADPTQVTTVESTPVDPTTATTDNTLGKQVTGSGMEISPL